MGEVRGSRVAGTLVAAQRVTAAHTPSVMAALVAVARVTAAHSPSVMAALVAAIHDLQVPPEVVGGRPAPAMTRGADAFACHDTE